MTPAIIKQQLIQETLRTLKSSQKEKKGDSDVKKKFAEEFYRQVPSEDLMYWEAENLSAIAGGLFETGQKHDAGTHELRIFNPSNKKNGWEAHRTVIEIINDDMPFLIDSIAAELAHQDLAIEVLFHPILKTGRDDKGVLKSIYKENKKVKDAVVESYIHIQLEQLLPEAGRKKLEKDLNKVIKDVAYATGDWRKMLSSLEGVVSDMDKMPASLDMDEVNEARAFLQFIQNNNFTFLGYRRDEFTKEKNIISSKAVKKTALGVLKSKGSTDFGIGENTPEIKALNKAKCPVMVSKLIDTYATVHRRVPLDAVSVKIFDKKGQMTGQHFFVGLFTSSTYSCRTSEIPLISRKVQETLKEARFGHDSHDHKALEHILEKFPRDELFQISVKQLVDMSYGILRLQERHRIALFMRPDPLGRHVSCLVYVPRDRFDSKLRMQIEQILEKRLGGECTNFYTTLDDSPLARILFTVLVDQKPVKKIDHKAIEQEIIEMGRAWPERLKASLIEAHGARGGIELIHKYDRAFPVSYQDQVLTSNAVHDISQLEKIISGDKITVDMYKLADMEDDALRLKVYHKNTPVPLSDILPILSHMGLRSIAESPFKIKPSGLDAAIWIHDFELKSSDGLAIDVEKLKENFEEAFLQTWFGHTENDGLNEMVLKAGLSWNEVNILRTYTGFLKQAKFPFSRRYVEQVLSDHFEITGLIIDLFKQMHDPALQNKQTASKAKKISHKIDGKLQSVAQLDHDRILRSFRGLVQKTLRTNYFQKDKRWLSMKMDSKNIEELPLPRPHVEIFVHSTKLEAVHLRGGEIARGGLRWSDRHDDFRTEVLGLMKSQMVKNAVIVPVGSKGGFIVKQPPKEGGRKAFMDEGIACYRMFIQALLDLTDNNIKGKIIRPKDVVCHDGIDPYLVVAADKGTATFSDYANELSTNAGFWLGDAFASGGSAGYDHKAMGITARGAWESVKRHFRELGTNIQKEEFTAVGVGDMGGDVFGNGMLLSKKTQLIGAFNHLHIFCDPNPDAATSFKERKRLFKARGGWDQYDTKLLSKGGKVFERSAKTLKLSKQIKERFGIEENEVTPSVLMRAMLKSQTDLLWFGGIGTYLKSSKESHADADDKGNDHLRLNARDLKVKVIGEGANLGMTQLARIEFCRNKGMCNTDFIDNSAGVDCSDHEVNIKILLSDVMESSKMTLAQRDKLLVKMTSEVSELVLKDNYQQTQALTFNLARGPQLLPRYAEFIRNLEKGGSLDRKIEFLPDEESIQRLLSERKGLTRPELSVLLSYAKIAFYKDLLASDIPDDATSQRWLYDYFPKELHGYKKQIDNHKLKREIIATNIANSLINRMGPVFVNTRMDKTGAKAADVVRAFIMVVESFGIQKLWDDIEALDNKVSTDVQTNALMEIFVLIKWSVTWILKHGGHNLDLKTEIGRMKPAVEELSNALHDIVPNDIKHNIEGRQKTFVHMGVPSKLAERIALLPVLVSACDIINISGDCHSDITSIAKTYFEIGTRLRLDWLRRQGKAIVPENHWENRVLSSLVDELYIYQAEITQNVIKACGCPTSKNLDVTDIWGKDRKAELEMINQILSDIKRAPVVDLSMMVLVGQQLRQLASS